MQARRPAAGVLPIVALLGGVVTSVPAVAGTIEFRVHGEDGGVRNAVVSATPANGEALPRPPAPTAVMDQRNKEFVPHVLPVLRGTSVRFPNSDNIRHNVYSFSKIRTFELRLYEGGDADPIEFDRAGVAVLGCNIHDWMLGYIVVLDTPAFARTGDEGRARITGLPAGSYRVRLWHPRLVDGASPAVRTVEVPAAGDVDLAYDLALTPPVDRRRGFAGEDDDSTADEFGRY